MGKDSIGSLQAVHLKECTKTMSKMDPVFICTRVVVSLLVIIKMTKSMDLALLNIIQARKAVANT